MSRSLVMRLRVPVLVFMLLASPGASVAQDQSAEAAHAPITVGEYLGMSGPLSSFGTSTDRGIRLAVDEINAAGGVHGHPLRLALRDDAGTPDGAKSAVQSLLADEHPTAIIGEVASRLSLAGAPLCQTAGVPMISPASTSPAVTKTGPYIFRACFEDSRQGRAAAQFAVSRLKAGRAAILCDAGSDYGSLLAQNFRTEFRRLGGKVVSEQQYDDTDVDFQPQLQRIKATRPTVLYLPAYYPQAALCIAQARRLGITGPIVGGDGWASPRLLAELPASTHNCYFTNHGALDAPDSSVLVFRSRFQAKYQDTEPDMLAVLGYDSVRLLAAALEKNDGSAGDYASPASRRRLRDTLAATRDFPSITGPLTFDNHRNVLRPVAIEKISQGRFQYVTSIPTTH